MHAWHTRNVKMWRYTLPPALTFKVYGLYRPLKPVPTPPNRRGSISTPFFGRYSDTVLWYRHTWTPLNQIITYRESAGESAALLTDQGAQSPSRSRHHCFGIRRKTCGVEESCSVQGQHLHTGRTLNSKVEKIQQKKLRVLLALGGGPAGTWSGGDIIVMGRTANSACSPPQSWAARARSPGKSFHSGRVGGEKFRGILPYDSSVF